MDSRFKASLLLPMALAVACTAAGEDQVAATQAALDAIERAREAWVVAANSDDMDGMLVVVPDDGLTMPPNEPAFTGKDALRAWHQARIDQFTTQISLSSEEVRVFDDWAVERFMFEITLVPRGTGQATTDTGKGMWLWERQADGSWQIAEAVWNTDAPPPSTQ